MNTDGFRHHVPTLALLLATATTACRATPFSPTGRAPVPVSVSGTVVDNAGRPVGGATVGVKNENGFFTATGITQDDGTYGFEGVSDALGKVLLEAVKPGFKPTMQTLTVAPGFPLHARFTLTTENPLDLAGAYTVDVIADPACTSLPPRAARRTYRASAVATTSPTAFLVVLDGATFIDGTPNLSAQVTSDFVRITVSQTVDIIDSGPVVEALGPEESVFLFGTARGAVSPGASAITTRFDGEMTYCLGPVEGTYYTSCALPFICRSGSHQLVLTPR